MTKLPTACSPTAVLKIAPGPEAFAFAGSCVTMATRDLLSKHETVAQFAGRTHRPCRFRTALCPDLCGHASDTLDFNIIHYLHHEKPGEYGDPKSEQYHFDIKKGQGRGPAASTQDSFSQQGASLAVGDYVLLSWVHEYVHDEGAHYPERPVTKMDKITPQEAEALKATGS